MNTYSFSRLVLQSLLLFLPLLFLTRLADAATLEVDASGTTAGYFRLMWTSEQATRLVESRDPDFTSARTIYQGDDLARVVSGVPDGDYYYRLESLDEGDVLTPPVKVSVQHHSLQRAWTFFGIGAVVFVGTAILVFVGARRAAA